MREPYFASEDLDEYGCPAWISALAGEASDPNHLVHVVLDLDPDDALNLLGADPEKIETCELPTRKPGELTSLARAAVHPRNPSVVLIAARIGGWTFVYDDRGETRSLSYLSLSPPPDAAQALSVVGLVAATGNVARRQVGFTYAIDGQILVQETEDVLNSDILNVHTGENGPPEVRAAIGAAAPTGSEKDTGISMRVVCALAGLPRTLDELRELPLFLSALGD